MSTEVVSIGSLERNISSLLDTLLATSPEELLDTQSEDSEQRDTLLGNYHDRVDKLESELKALSDSESIEGNSTAERLANLVVTVVHATYAHGLDYPSVVTQKTEVPPDSGLPANIAASIGASTQMSFRSIGWDGQNWRSTASQPSKPISGSIMEFKERGLDAFLDLLGDVIKQSLMQSEIDFLSDNLKRFLGLALDATTCAAVSTNPVIGALIGSVLLFSIHYFRSDAITIPDDCECLWYRIQEKGLSGSSVTPKQVIADFRYAAGLYPKPTRLARCTRGFSSCPFRSDEKDRSGDLKSYCLLVYDDISLTAECTTDEESPKVQKESRDEKAKESRDEKVYRAFQKLESLGLLTTRIDCEPDEYYLA